jgi:hypothetical protein
MKKKYILFILICLVFSNCKNETKSKETSVDDNLELILNNNEKWLVNPETHKGIKIMDSIISVFKKKKDKDYKTLGENLSKQTSYIIKNCSMKGEPHDQLHVVLVPMLDEIGTLKESNNYTKSKKALTQLETLIQLYFSHFKL